MEYNDDGLSALIFTSEGDMRQAINNLQSTHSGFGFISGDNVFKVCDQPHPVTVQAIIRGCMKGDIDQAMEKLSELWNDGYSAVDIVVTDRPTGQAALVAYPDFTLLDFGGGENDFAVSEEEINIGISMKKGNTALKDAINEVLATMTTDDYNAMMEEAIKAQPLNQG